MKYLTGAVNHNNTISGGHEKDVVVSMLDALHNAGVRMDGMAMQAWALANGWSGKNPERLPTYVDAVNAGKRLKYRNVLRAEYVEKLRQGAATDN